MGSHEDGSTLLATTMVLSLASVAYILRYFNGKIEKLEATKRDIDEMEAVEEDMYQAWSGTFADGTNSLVATIVWKKCNTKYSNQKWVTWDGEEDASVINRNFYLGNNAPSFDWQIQSHGATGSKAILNETLTDGWDSVVYIKIVSFLESSTTKNEMDSLLKEIVSQGRIEWERCLLSKQELTELLD